MRLLTKFNEFAKQRTILLTVMHLQWLVLLVAKQRWRYAIFALEGGAEVALVLVTQMIADGGKVVGS